MNIVEKGENFFDTLGLMTGNGAELKRMTCGALAAGFFMTYLKPSFAFHEGQIRPWSLLAGEKPEVPPTPVTLWHVMILGAFVSGVLI